MSKKKIAYVNFHFFDTDVTVIKELQKAFDVEWFVILRDRDEAYHQEFFENFVKGTGINLHIYKYECRRRSWKFFWLLLKVMRDVLKAKVSLVYSSCADHLYLQLALRTIPHRVPIVNGIHDVKQHSSANPSKPEKLGRSLCFDHGKYFFTFSKNQYKIFNEIYPGKKCYMVGMSSKYFGKSKLTLPKKSEGTRFLMFGSMNKYKGYDLLIENFERILAIDNTPLLSLYGSAHEEDAKFIEEHTKHKDNYNLHIEFVDNNIIKDIYSTHHFAVMPYRDATQSGPLMIAVSYGIPVIAPKFGIFEDIFSPENTIFYDPKDEKGLYNALLKAISMSDEEYLVLRKACSALKQEYSEESIGKNYIRAFNEILDTLN